MVKKLGKSEGLRGSGSTFEIITPKRESWRVLKIKIGFKSKEEVRIIGEREGEISG